MKNVKRVYKTIAKEGVITKSIKGSFYETENESYNTMIQSLIIIKDNMIDYATQFFIEGIFKKMCLNKELSDGQKERVRQLYVQYVR